MPGARGWACPSKPSARKSRMAAGAVSGEESSLSMRSRQRGARETAPSAWARSNTPSAPSACAEDRGSVILRTGVRASPGISRSRSCPSSESGRRPCRQARFWLSSETASAWAASWRALTSRRAMRARLSSVRPRKVRVSLLRLRSFLRGEQAVGDAGKQAIVHTQQKHRVRLLGQKVAQGACVHHARGGRQRLERNGGKPAFQPARRCA